ncbi:MAG: hypothetical protein P8M22_05360 [Phycisphaerales bacterium]|nr:hypothetical protein [Phycisphaerales bacterium]
MIKPAPQHEPGGSRGERINALRVARQDFTAVTDAMDPLLEALCDESLDDLRPQLSEMMKRLLDGTRIVVESAQTISSDLDEEVETAQWSLSERLLDFRRAMGSGSADTIRQSLRVDLEASAVLWNRLLDGLIEHVQSNEEDA